MAAELFAKVLRVVSNSGVEHHLAGQLMQQTRAADKWTLVTCDDPVILQSMLQANCSHAFHRSMFQFGCKAQVLADLFELVRGPS